MTSKIEYSAKFKRNYVAFFAVAIFVLMVISEVFLAISIPAYMNRENSMAFQVRKLNFLNDFDATRSICDRISAKDETLMLEKQLLAASLDSTAIYLRREADFLSSQEIADLHALTKQLQRIAARLASGQKYSKENKLDTVSYIDRLVKNQTEDKRHGGK